MENKEPLFKGLEDTIFETESQDKLDLTEMFAECFVDLDIPAKPLDTLVYMGTSDTGEKCSVITRGEYSAIVASAKTKKSFCKSLITASFIGGETNNYSTHIEGNRTTDGYIIDLDTEQGEFYAKKTFKRVELLVGSRYPKYIPLMMRKKSVQDRIDMIDWLIYDSKYAGNIDLLLVDGIADLVYNTNDIEEGAKIAEKMLRWTAEGLHICTIIHKAGNNDKARGHLGTAVTIKAESIIFMDRIMDEQGNITEKNTVRVRCGYVRGLPFEDFYLTINNEGMPFTHTDQNDNIFTSDTSKDYSDVCMGTLDEAFGKPEDNGIAF